LPSSSLILSLPPHSLLHLFFLRRASDIARPSPTHPARAHILFLAHPGAHPAGLPRPFILKGLGVHTHVFSARGGGIVHDDLQEILSGARSTFAFPHFWAEGFVRCGGRGDVLIWCGRCGVLNVVSRARLSWVFVCFARAHMLHGGGVQGVCASRGVVVGCGGRGRTCHRCGVFDARYFDLTFFFLHFFPSLRPFITGGGSRRTCFPVTSSSCSFSSSTFFLSFSSSSAHSKRQNTY
jgi:hypothetical protein